MDSQRGFIQLLHLVYGLHMAMPGHIGQIIQREYNVIHGQRLPIVPGDPLIHRKRGDNLAVVLRDLPASHQIGLGHIICIKLQKWRCTEGCIVHSSKSAVIVGHIKDLRRGQCPDFQLFHNASGGAARRFGGRALRCALLRRLCGAAEQIQRQRAGQEQR